jgi:hypothetical protein
VRSRSRARRVAPFVRSQQSGRSRRGCCSCACCSGVRGERCRRPSRRQSARCRRAASPERTGSAGGASRCGSWRPEAVVSDVPVRGSQPAARSGRGLRSTRTTSPSIYAPMPLHDHCLLSASCGVWQCWLGEENLSTAVLPDPVKLPVIRSRRDPVPLAPENVPLARFRAGGSCGRTGPTRRSPASPAMALPERDRLALVHESQNVAVAADAELEHALLANADGALPRIAHIQSAGRGLRAPMRQPPAPPNPRTRFKPPSPVASTLLASRTLGHIDPKATLPARRPCRWRRVAGQRRRGTAPPCPRHAAGARTDPGRPRSLPARRQEGG